MELVVSSYLPYSQRLSLSEPSVVELHKCSIYMYVLSDDKSVSCSLTWKASFLLYGLAVASGGLSHDASSIRGLFSHVCWAGSFLAWPTLNSFVLSVLMCIFM